MTPLHVLVVEDDPALAGLLRARYESLFAAHGYAAVFEEGSTVHEARRLAKAARGHPYDFVSLDVNLGDSLLTGLDVLDTLKRFRSAWMVAVLTGVEADSTLDVTMGREKGDQVRRQLRRDAHARFPAERLLVVEKPLLGAAGGAAETLLANRLEQIVLVFEEIAKLRYVFRPIEVMCLARVPVSKGTRAKRKFIETTTRHWQIRYNCGEMRTLPDMAGLRTVHYLLSRGTDGPISPEEALANEPKEDKTATEPPAEGVDPVAAYFEGQGIAWTSISSAEQENLIRAALSLRFKRYRDLRGYQDDNDLTGSEETELTRIVADLGPLADVAETAYQRIRPLDEAPIGTESPLVAALRQEGLHLGGGNYDRIGVGRRGQDSPAAQLFRARMKRVKDYLRENGFSDLAEHLESCVASTGASWSYQPPEGLTWTT